MPDFPDPTFGAGGAQVNLHVPVDMGSSPAFYLAQQACAKLGLELAGYSRSYHPSATEMAQALVIARCMRAHGVPNWPDPARTMPSDPWRYHVQGAVPGPAGASPVFLIPKSIDFEAPAVKQAAITCHDI